MVEGIACAKKLVAYRAHDEARKELRNCAENALFINQSLKDVGIMMPCCSISDKKSGVDHEPLKGDIRVESTPDPNCGHLSATPNLGGALAPRNTNASHTGTRRECMHLGTRSWRHLPIEHQRPVGHWPLVACVSSATICGLACCCASLTAVLPAPS
jgi:hypothetical protein